MIDIMIYKLDKLLDLLDSSKYHNINADFFVVVLALKITK